MIRNQGPRVCLQSAAIEGSFSGGYKKYHIVLQRSKYIWTITTALCDKITIQF